MSVVVNDPRFSNRWPTQKTPQIPGGESHIPRPLEDVCIYTLVEVDVKELGFTFQCVLQMETLLRSLDLRRFEEKGLLHLRGTEKETESLGQRAITDPLCVCVSVCVRC